ncbi:hypothetical protein KKG56_11720, partial [bacterium]|nr:hypothetical protein [bacterium]
NYSAIVILITNDKSSIKYNGTQITQMNMMNTDNYKHSELLEELLKYSTKKSYLIITISVIIVLFLDAE